MQDRGAPCRTRGTSLLPQAVGQGERWHQESCWRTHHPCGASPHLPSRACLLRLGSLPFSPYPSTPLAPPKSCTWPLSSPRAHQISLRRIAVPTSQVHCSTRAWSSFTAAFNGFFLVVVVCLCFFSGWFGWFAFGSGRFYVWFWIFFSFLSCPSLCRATVGCQEQTQRLTQHVCQCQGL